jgi:hypothetical protein
MTSSRHASFGALCFFASLNTYKKKQLEVCPTNPSKQWKGKQYQTISEDRTTSWCSVQRLFL